MIVFFCAEHGNIKKLLGKVSNKTRKFLWFLDHAHVDRKYPCFCVLCVSNIKISVEYSNWRKRYSPKETENCFQARYIWLPLKAFCAALVAAVEAAFAAAV